MDTKTAALADLDATLRNLDEARKALEAGDLARLTTALKARQWVFPESVWRAHREMREAQVSTFYLAPERVRAPPVVGHGFEDFGGAREPVPLLERGQLPPVSVRRERILAPFSELAGRTILGIDGAVENSGEVRIVTDIGVFVLMHERDCCEFVEVVDVTGDPADLVGAVVRLAEESVKEGEESDDGTSTWTFYRLQTDKGDLDIRWLGASNGYYSEGVSMYREARHG